MAEGPINYAGLLSQVDLSPLQRGLQLRSYNRAQEAQAQQQQVENEQRRTVTQLAQVKFTHEQERDAAYQAALQDYSTSPTAQGLLSLSARFPEHQAALESGFKTYSAAQQQDIISAATSSLAALQGGKPDLAIDTLTKRQGALAKAGVDTSHTDALIGMLKSGDPAKIAQAKSMLAVVLSGAVGADHAGSILSAYGLDESKNADDARADAAFKETQRHNRAGEANAAADNARADRADARAAAKAKAGGAKKKGAFSNADLDALLQ